MIVTSAHAQSTSLPDATSEAASHDDGLEIVVVGARKRAEDSQDVPISIQALSSDDITARQIQTTTDLQQHITGIVVSGPTGGSNGRTQASFSVRGKAASSMALYYGGLVVPTDNQGRSNGMLGRNLWDLESIQVAKGPQGTFAGRNATGGALYFQPKRPVNEIEGTISVSYDNLQRKDLTAVVNLPVVDDRLLVRFGVQRVRQPGYTHNLTPGGSDLDDVDYTIARASAILRPTDWLENYTLFSFYHANEHAAGFVLRALYPATCTPSSTALVCLYPQATAELPQVDPRHTFTPQGVNLFNRATNILLSNITTITLNDTFNIRNTFGYQDDQNRDLNSPAGIKEPVQLGYFTSPREYTSDELLLNFGKQNSPLHGVIGAYIDGLRFKSYHNTDMAIDGSTVTPFYGNYVLLNYGTRAQAVSQGLILHRPVTSEAVFANVSYRFGGWLERFSVSGGYRYTWLRATQVSQNLTNGRCAFAATTVGLDPVACVARQHAVFNSPSWVGNINYKFTDHVMAYGSVSRGFKEGGFNISAPTPNLVVYGPEHVTTYEIGLKADWHLFDRPIRTNLAAYTEDYTGIQRTTTVAYTDPLGVSRVSVLTQNAAKGRVRGVEAELQYLPTTWLSLDGNYAYTFTKYLQFNSLSSSGQPLDLSGTPFPNAPRHTVSIAATVKMPVDERAGTVEFTTSFYHRSTNFFTADGDPLNRSAPISLVNSQLSWNGIMGSKFDAAVYVQNLFNKLYTFSQITLAGKYASSLYSPPRVIGGRLSISF